MAKKAHFTPRLFQFFEELKVNNNKEWFTANKKRFEQDVRDPCLQFVVDFATVLPGISPHYVADPRPNGGSIFRINRDIRFANDKSPYKTNAGVHFKHEAGKDVHAPGFYLHLQPGEVFGGVGLWKPEPDSLGKIRDAIAANSPKWQRVKQDALFTKNFKLEGESLSRPPKGYAPDHPQIEDIKRKDFLVSRQFTVEETCAPGFIDKYAEMCRQSAPLMEFLTTAVGLPW